MKTNTIARGAAGLTSSERINAIAWKASLAKLSYGKYVVNLTEKEREAILQEYAQHLAEVRMQEAERLREWSQARKKAAPNRQTQ